MPIYFFAYLDQSVPDLPAEHGPVLLLVLLDLVLDLRGGDPWFGPADDTGPDGAGLLVAVEDLADTAVADTELPGDHTGPDAGSGHLDNLEPDVVGQGAAVDEEAAELVDTALT